MYAPATQSDVSTPFIHGLGIFDSGFDVSTWGIAEWGLAALGIYAAASLFGDAKLATKKVRRRIRRLRA